MTNQSGHGFENFGRKIDETVNKAAPRVEEELKKIITFLNEEVVPKVREHSSKGLRVAADQLTKLAEHLDRTRQNPPDPGQSQ
jgi:predicted DNA-binding protein (UPF0278 family)